MKGASMVETILSRNFDAILEVRHLIAIILACLCGLAIGYERKSRNKQAGIKTHVIVALTSALMMLISKEAFLDTSKFDTARVAAQVVSGISFIGGGIIFMRDKKISGITTASGIWATAGIGLAIGGGMWIFGVVCAAVVVIIQLLTHESPLKAQNRQVSIHCLVPDVTIMQKVYDFCHLEDYQAVQVEAKELDEGQFELILRVEHDEEIVIEKIQEYMEEQHSDLEVKKIKFKTEEY
jgi:mgtC family protein